MQLDALLGSMEEFTPDVQQRVVLWTASNDAYQRGYCLAFAAHPDVKYVFEDGFCAQVQDLLANIQTRYVSFLVDDDIYFRSPRVPLYMSKRTCFSPHLGKNTTYSYGLERNQIEGDGDFTVWFSLDGHVYHTDEIRDALVDSVFTNPNELEDSFKPLRGHRIIYNNHSSLVGIPNNRVGCYPNRHDGGDPSKINDMFLLGKRINRQAMNFSTVIGMHQSIDYVFKERE